ncbi:MAG: hypothetical protein K6T16_02295 [Candidatus Pacearchaeota archaeon]|nr:hypothetical protein [Candidatus Pacearchaeota archaeon]
MTKKRDKRGWILIVEAVLAILVLFSFLFMTIARQASQAKQFDKEEYFYSVMNTLALKAEKDAVIRSYVVQEDPNIELIENLLGLELRLMGVKKIGLNATVCDVEEVCDIEIKAEDVYTTEVVIVTEERDYKKLKIFIWES